jgi:acetyl-CoA/propionyl-CoA carboxylase biotin carboxyl carrier protein
VDAVAEAPGARTDSGIAVGSVIGADYDPMLAKVIVHAPDRAMALARLDAALGATVVGGVTTNVAFLRRLVTQPDVVAGRLDTGLIDRSLPDLLAGPDAFPSPRAWGDRGGWRHGAERREITSLRAGRAAGVSRRGTGTGARPGEIRSPMPGTVIALGTEAGAAVSAGQVLVIVEAMKMEHALRAGADGTVSAVHVAVGQKVALDELLVELARET